jgi:hypothetical protein
MKSADEIVERVRRELASGRAWRAKEILAGHIAGGRIEDQILEEYGRLLDALGDRVEGGKYLFLSGARSEQYLPSIELFKTRHGRRHGRDLVAQFPSAFRGQAFERIDPALREELAALGVTPDSFGARRESGAAHIPLAPWRGHLAVAMFLAVLLFLFFAIIVGLQTMVGWARK